MIEEIEKNPKEDEYGHVEFGAGENEDHQGQQSDGSQKYHQGPYYELDDNDDDPLTWPLNSSSISDSQGVLYDLFALLSSIYIYPKSFCMTFADIAIYVP